MNTENNNEFGFTDEELKQQQEARAERKSQPKRVITITLTETSKGIEHQVNFYNMNMVEALGAMEVAKQKIVQETARLS